MLRVVPAALILGVSLLVGSGCADDRRTAGDGDAAGIDPLERTTEPSGPCRGSPPTRRAETASRAEGELRAELGSGARVTDVRFGTGRLVDLVVCTELHVTDRLGAKAICTSLKQGIQDVDAVRVVARPGTGNRQIFAAACVGR